MSGADELDEAIALANESAANDSSQYGSSRRSGEEPDRGRGEGHSGRRADAQSGPADARPSAAAAETSKSPEPPEGRAVAADVGRSGPGQPAGSTDDLAAGEGGADADEVAAPEWLTRRTAAARPGEGRRSRARGPTPSDAPNPRSGDSPSYGAQHHGHDRNDRNDRNDRRDDRQDDHRNNRLDGQGHDRDGHRDDHRNDHRDDQGHGRDSGHRPLGWPEARAYAARSARPLPSRTLPLDDSSQHTLAAPLTARTDLPPFDTSAMDGWAVYGPGPWALAEGPESPGILAGDQREQRPLADGQAVRIATGARLPAGASAVLRSEYGQLSGARLSTSHRHQPQPGTDIRPRGQECRSGDRLLPAGTTVTPAVLGLAAAAGYDQLTVVRRPRVEVLVLGEELLHRGPPRDGRIRDALGPMVGPWLSALGAEVLVTRRLGDDAEALYEAMAATTADLVVTTGGTARGPVDHVRPTLRRLGARLLVDGVGVRPGHPMLLARLPAASPRTGPGPDPSTTEVTAQDTARDTTEYEDSAEDEGAAEDTADAGQSPLRGPHFVGLPGNPLAALSGLVTLAAPLLRTLADRPAQPELRAPLIGEVRGHPRDTRLVPVAYSPAESHVRPLHYTGPAMLRGIATATALAVVPPGGAASDAEVRLLTLPWISALAW